MTPWDRDETLRLCAIQVEAARAVLDACIQCDRFDPYATMHEAIRLLSQHELAARLRAVREQT
jgi:hypothetical protein